MSASFQSLNLTFFFFFIDMVRLIFKRWFGENFLISFSLLKELSADATVTGVVNNILKPINLEMFQPFSSLLNLTILEGSVLVFPN